MSDPNREWESGWTGHEEQQMRRLARLSLPEKLAWLEQAQRLVATLDSPPEKSEEGEPDTSPGR